MLLLRLVTTTKEAGVDMDGQKRGSIENTLFRTQEISAHAFESELKTYQYIYNLWEPRMCNFFRSC